MIPFHWWTIFGIFFLNGQKLWLHWLENLIYKFCYVMFLYLKLCQYLLFKFCVIIFQCYQLSFCEIIVSFVNSGCFRATHLLFILIWIYDGINSYSWFSFRLLCRIFFLSEVDNLFWTRIVKIVFVHVIKRRLNTWPVSVKNFRVGNLALFTWFIWTRLFTNLWSVPCTEDHGLTSFSSYSSPFAQALSAGVVHCFYLFIH